jgi:ribosomal protein L32
MALDRIFLAKCINCSSAVKPHAVCSICGYYRGKKIIDVKRVVAILN